MVLDQVLFELRVGLGRRGQDQLILLPLAGFAKLAEYRDDRADDLSVPGQAGGDRRPGQASRRVEVRRGGSYAQESLILDGLSADQPSASVVEARFEAHVGKRTSPEAANTNATGASHLAGQSAPGVLLTQYACPRSVGARVSLRVSRLRACGR